MSINENLEKVDKAFNEAKNNAKVLRYNLLQVQGLLLSIGVRPPEVITQLLDDMRLKMSVIDHEIDYIFHLLYQD